MTEFRYGPVEMYLVEFIGDQPDPASMKAFADVLASGVIRLMDFVLLSKDDDGEVTVTEIEDPAKLGLEGVELHHVGIAGEEDIAEFAELIPPHSCAALVSFELTYARTLASALDAAGAMVLRSERVPAPIVNVVVELAEFAEQADQDVQAERTEQAADLVESA